MGQGQLRWCAPPGIVMDRADFDAASCFSCFSVSLPKSPHGRTPRAATRRGIQSQKLAPRGHGLIHHRKFFVHDRQIEQQPLVRGFDLESLQIQIESMRPILIAVFGIAAIRISGPKRGHHLGIVVSQIVSSRQRLECIFIVSFEVSSALPFSSSAFGSSGCTANVARIPASAAKRGPSRSNEEIVPRCCLIGPYPSSGSRYSKGRAAVYALARRVPASGFRRMLNQRERPTTKANAAAIAP